MKSKFLAGVIATLVSLITVIGLSLFLALVLDVDPSKNWFTTTAAFLTIGSWLGVYKWLKPKNLDLIDEDGNEIEPAINQIDDAAFKAAYLKTTKLAFKGGVFLILIGIPGAVSVLVFAEDLMERTNLIGFIILLLFGILGIVALMKTIQKKKKILDGSDPLMNAVNNNISDYVVWFHGVITQQEGNFIKDMRSFSIVIYSREMKKAVNMVIKGEQSYNEVMLFLASKFPSAETGYDAETKKRMKEKYGFKGLMQ